MNASEPITLYRCKSCSKQVFLEDVQEGVGCTSCGSRYVCNAPANARYMAGYLLRHPGLIGRFLMEDVLGFEANA